jgi:hypothetical protein
MRWVISVIACWLIASHLGCHHSCGNSFPMQGMNRVPPPGTGSYPMQGGYYNAPMGMQSATPMQGSAPSMASNSAGGFPQAVDPMMVGQNPAFTSNAQASTRSGEAFATYETPQPYGSIPNTQSPQPASVATAGGSVPLQGQPPVVSASLSDSVPNLQWQQ